MELHLTRIVIDPRDRTSRAVLRDVHHAHRVVMAGFPDVDDGHARERFAVLWRYDRPVPPTLLVQSSVPPDHGALSERLAGSRIETKRIGEILQKAISPGRVLSFRLVANPTRKIDTKSGPEGRRRHGRRVPLRRDPDRLAWLDRRFGASGARPVVTDGVADVRIGASTTFRGRRDGRDVTVEGVDFEGRLVVDDTGRFLEALRSGIGPGKAYGMGLLTVARP